MATDTEEQKIKINGKEINYLKVGNGPRTVLLLPGALGSIWADFKHQIENLDRDKFTIVAWDPPGYGKSRPPDRTFNEDYFAEDAVLVRDLMKAIGYERFSVFGWGDGAISSLFLAGKNPEIVEKMIILGAHAYITPEDLKVYIRMKKMDSWSDAMKAPFIEAYGENYAKKTWLARAEIIGDIFVNKKGNICKDLLEKIECPTLIVYGTYDVMVTKEHPPHLNKHIKNSTLKVYEHAAHDLHKTRHKDFNQLITEFLSGE